MQLARKLTLPLALFAFLALGISAWLSVREAVELHHADVERDQLAAGRLFLEALDRERARGTADEAAKALLAASNRDPSRTITRLVSLEETELNDSQRAALARGEPVFTLDVWRTAETWLPTTLSDGRPGAAWVHESLEAERGFLTNVITSHVLNAASLGVLWAVVAVGLGAVVVGRPMRSLTEKARRVSEGDYAGPLQIPQQDEIGVLAKEMNHMCDELLAARHRLFAETTDKESAQAALRHADRLTTVGLLAAGIAHELGTPLNVVSMRARMIETGEVLGDDARASASVIHGQSGQMTRIIRQLLDFARRSTPSMSRFRVEVLAERCASILQPLAEKANVRLVVSAGGAHEIEGDQDQLQQAVTNLVVNGIQAMPQGGAITLAVSEVRAKPPADVGGEEARYARLTVHDEGPGIPPEVLPRVFEPFFTTKPVGEGNGLGLPVAWGIVRDHHGWIAVQSANETGTTFSLFLPLERPQA